MSTKFEHAIANLGGAQILFTSDCLAQLSSECVADGGTINDIGRASGMTTRMRDRAFLRARDHRSEFGFEDAIALGAADEAALAHRRHAGAARGADNDRLAWFPLCSGEQIANHKRVSGGCRNDAAALDCMREAQVHFSLHAVGHDRLVDFSGI